MMPWLGQDVISHKAIYFPNQSQQTKFLFFMEVND